MAKHKRIKSKEIKIRVTPKLFNIFDKYVKDKNITKTKVIEEYLQELLKDKLV